MEKNNDFILEIKNLNLSYGANRILSSFNFSQRRDTITCITGKSGIGKTTVMMAVVDPDDLVGATIDGEIYFDNVRIDNKSRRQRADFCRGRLSVMLQDSASSLDPVMTVGRQMLEVLGNKEMVKKQLADVLFDNPDEIYKMYPHNLSGGMKQRVCLAMAIGSNPKLLILDEPYANIDEESKKQLMSHIIDKKRETQMAVLIITHDRKQAIDFADEIIVME